MGFLFFVIVVGLVWWLIAQGRQQKALQRGRREAFLRQHAGWDVYIAPFDQSVIGLNHDQRAVVLGTIDRHKAYPWSSLTSVEIIRNGTSITSTNRGSQIMGAAIGDLLLGPVGLILGGATGSKRTVQRISQIGIKIIVDDRSKPIHTADFLRLPGAGADPKNRLVQSAVQRAEHVHALLFNAMRTASTSAHVSPEALSGPSKSDQIAELWKLKEIGALTATEFEAQKAVVLRA